MRIFLDQDDVCNTFTMYALQRIGCKVSATDYAEHPPVGYDIVAAANRLGGWQYTVPDFWDSISREVWATVPESEVFPWLLEEAARLAGRENVCIATAPTKDPDCLAGKLEWIHRHFPAWMHRQYVLTPRKHFLAQPGAVLIDDNEENVRQFEAHGGTGILVPRPWNSAWGKRPLAYLKEKLRGTVPSSRRLRFNQ